MSTAVEEKKATAASFGVEADHPRNSDLLIQSIPGCRLRGGIKASRSTKNAKTGDEMIPVDQATHLGRLPEIPGMQIHVDPKALKYLIVDPLEKNEALCEKVTRGLLALGVIHDEKAQGVHGIPKQSGELDKHRMKTLCRELLRLKDLGHVKVMNGSMPAQEVIDKLPGDYLLNPGATAPNTQPRYEKEMDRWVTALNRSGG